MKARLFATPGGGFLNSTIFAFDYCGRSSDPPNVSHRANLQRGQTETVWSTAAQTGGDIWGRGTLVPVRPHTDPVKGHRPEHRREQEFD